MTQTSFIQIPLELINYVRSLHLFSRNPNDDPPTPAQIATKLGVNPRTFSRALAKLQEFNLVQVIEEKGQ
jgi:Mn-dependent DtxR family transcriptional regulator